MNVNELDFGKVCISGRKRLVNQDSAEVLLPTPISLPYPLMVVADGMGGYAGGEIASGYVLSAFRELYFTQNNPISIEAFLSDCVNKAHLQVKSKAKQDLRLNNMGSTVVAAVIENNQVHVINVGDSRAYLAADHAVHVISKDQSYVADLVRAGLVTNNEARRHPKKNVLTMAINSRHGQLVTNYQVVPFTKQDVLLLCSDGLWGVVPESIIYVGLNDFSAQEGAEKLAKFANQNGGPDNISVLIAKHRDRISDVEAVGNTITDF